MAGRMGVGVGQSMARALLCGLSFMGRYGFQGGREPRMSCRIDRPVLYRGARGVLAEEVVAFPVLRWPDRSGSKSAAAVRADVFQDGSDTCGAKSALVGADARFERIGRQRVVAVLTGGSELEHAQCLSCGCLLANDTPDYRAFKFERIGVSA